MMPVPVTNWIKMTDQAPVDGQEILFWYQDSIYLGMYHVTEKGTTFFAAYQDNVDPDATEVSHWMPLPEPPGARLNTHHPRQGLDMTDPRLDEIPTDFVRDFTALCHDERPVEIASTRYRLWCLFAAVQLASRHPNAMQTRPMQTAVEVARSIQALLSTTPALARIAEQGWDQTSDA